MASSGPFFGRCGKKNLAIGLRKYRRPLISSLGYQVTLARNLSLQIRKYSSDGDVPGRIPNG